MTIAEKNIDGEQLLCLSTLTWEAEIAVSNNANLIRLRHIPSGLEILRTPNSLAELRQTPERYGMPLLFPPGRIARGRFSWNDREYVFPVNEPEKNCNLHGLLLGNPWTLAETGHDESEPSIKMSLDFDSRHPNYIGFPHEFRVELTYHFLGDSVIQETRVINQGRCPMPFGIGFHTAFRLPFGSHSAIAEQQCRIMATSSDKRWEMSDSSRLPTGKLLPLKDEEKFNGRQGLGIGSSGVGMLCPAETQQGFRGAVITSPADKVKVIYEVSEEFNFWALWNDGGGKGFFCIEPLTWLSNAPNLDISPELTGMYGLKPKCSWRGKCKIILQRKVHTNERSVIDNGADRF